MSTNGFCDAMVCGCAWLAAVHSSARRLQMHRHLCERLTTSGRVRELPRVYNLPPLLLVSTVYCRSPAFAYHCAPPSLRRTYPHRLDLMRMFRHVMY